MDKSLDTLRDELNSASKNLAPATVGPVGGKARATISDFTTTPFAITDTTDVMNLSNARYEHNLANREQREKYGSITAGKRTGLSSTEPTSRSQSRRRDKRGTTTSGSNAVQVANTFSPPVSKDGPVGNPLVSSKRKQSVRTGLKL